MKKKLRHFNTSKKKASQFCSNCCFGFYICVFQFLLNIWFWIWTSCPNKKKKSAKKYNYNAIIYDPPVTLFKKWPPNNYMEPQKSTDLISNIKKIQNKYKARSNELT
ncbi:hypothetical protein BpHYR1_022980 [Brachionus plicatilis]|uniref:Uncharacterized protein n=1 Tax=Brachionus plicatilis TaxID=10195 RepID=A0A3M7SKF7_BRAPC|nr:hypothetical protein BpHYR1_022980 [Brachionus plicatilis]